MSKGLEALNEILENTDTDYVYRYWDGDSPLDTVRKELKALEIIKVLFQGRCKLYERTEHIETCNEEGCHAEKIATTSYILEFHNYDLHYEFHLRKEEYDLLKEALL